MVVLAVAARAVHDIALDDRAVLVVVAADHRVHVLAVAVVAVVASDHVASTRARDVDAIAVAKHFHRVVDVIVLDEVLAAVEEPLALLPTEPPPFALRIDAGLAPAHGPGALAVAFGIPPDASAYDDARVRHMVDVVVSDAVLAALPGEDAGRAPVDFADVVDVVVHDLVAPVYVLRARAVAGE